MTGLYRVGGKNIRIESIWPSVHAFCRDYRTEGAADFTARADASDLAELRERSEQAARSGRGPAGPFRDDDLEITAIYQKIAERMPEYGTLLMHGAAVAVDGEAYLFIAGSGTGKSTHARLWQELLGSRAVIVNGDKPLVHIEEKGAAVYGTPWCGKEGLNTNTVVPLKAVCILERAAENVIRPVSPADAFPSLLEQTYRPPDPAVLARIVRLTDLLRKNTKVYRLGCRPDLAAAELSYRTMKEG